MYHHPDSSQLFKSPADVHEFRRTNQSKLNKVFLQRIHTNFTHTENQKRQTQPEIPSTAWFGFHKHQILTQGKPQNSFLSHLDNNCFSKKSMAVNVVLTCFSWDENSQMHIFYSKVSNCDIRRYCKVRDLSMKIVIVFQNQTTWAIHTIHIHSSL